MRISSNRLNLAAREQAIRRVLLAQARMNYGFVTASNMFASSILGAIAWPHVPKEAIASWLLVFNCLVIARAYVLLRCLPSGDSGRAIRLTSRRLTILAACYGLLVGLPIPWWMPQLPIVEIYITLFVLAGWMATLTVTAVTYPKDFYLFTLPIAVSVSGFFLFNDPYRYGLALSGLVVTFFLFQHRFFRQSFSVMLGSIMLARHNSKLVRTLAQEKAASDSARRVAERISHEKIEFLAAASHDLRQPLTALKLFVDVIKRENDPQELRRVAKRISAGLESLDALLESLLDLSRLEAGVIKPEIVPVPVGCLVRRIAEHWRPAIEDKGLRFEVHAEELWIETAETEFERIIVNLLENAFRYTERGTIAIAVREIGAGEIGVSIEDTGAGIPDDERERIFNDFYQISNPARDRTKGRGLGLGVVRRLVRLLGLRLELESNLGRGSKFTVTGRRCEPRAAATPTKRLELPMASLTGRRILVIEDDLEVREAVCMLLAVIGLDPVAAASGEEALVAIEHRAPDLILADYRLRDGENGVRLLQEVFRRYGPIPSVVLSGDTAPERLREADEAGFPMLHKPVVADDLEAALRSALRNIPGDDPL